MWPPKNIEPNPLCGSMKPIGVPLTKEQKSSMSGYLGSIEESKLPVPSDDKPQRNRLIRKDASMTSDTAENSPLSAGAKLMVWLYFSLPVMLVALIAPLFVFKVATIIVSLAGFSLILAHFFESAESENEEENTPIAVCSVSSARNWLAKAAADPDFTDATNTLEAQLNLMEELMDGQEKTATYKQATELLEQDLPKLVAFYLNVPEQLRDSDYLGQSPDAMLKAGLEKISAKAGETINLLKQGPLDSLAVHTRYLDYR